jgi:hypothetical protein
MPQVWSIAKIFPLPIAALERPAVFITGEKERFA